MNGLLISFGCVASQPEKDQKNNGKSKTNNIKILADKLKPKKADDKEQLVDKYNFDVLEETREEKNEIKDGVTQNEAKDDAENTAKAVPNDMKTYVLVVNGSVKKRFVFKDSMKVVNGQVYKCKNGFNEQNVLVYNRALWIGKCGSSHTDKEGNEEVAAVMELS